MLSGLFSISWARTAHHPGENFWIHACTPSTCMHIYIAYVFFVFGSYRSSYSYVMGKMIREAEKGSVLKGKMVNIDHFSQHI